MSQTSYVLPVARPCSASVSPGPAGAAPPAAVSVARPALPPRSSAQQPAIEARSLRPAPAPSALRSVALFVTPYVLGGAAPLFLRQGRRRAVWAAAGLAAAAAWVAIVLEWPTVVRLAAGGRLPLALCLGGLATLTLLGTAAWGRALVLAGRDERYRPDRLPARLRRPWLVGALGLVFPGLGLQIAARPRRAFLALWNAACVSLAALALAQARLLWAWNAQPASGGLPAAALEVVFIACTGIVTLGGLLWIASALDGARLLGAGSRHRRVVRSDWLALALLASGVAFAMTFRPARLARDADGAALGLRGGGYRLIPLCLDLAAARLDPGRPEYAMHAAQLYVERGERDAARAIYDRLHERWESFAQMLLREEASSRAPMQSQLIVPGPDLTPQRGAPSLGRE